MDKKDNSLITVIAENIIQRRIELNWTQEKLAEESNLSVSFISKLERTDVKDVSISRLQRLSNALRVSLEQIVKSEKIPPTKLNINTIELIDLISDLDDSELSLNLIAILKKIQ